MRVYFAADGDYPVTGMAFPSGLDSDTDMSQGGSRAVKAATQVLRRGWQPAFVGEGVWYPFTQFYEQFGRCSAPSPSFRHQITHRYRNWIRFDNRVNGLIAVSLIRFPKGPRRNEMLSRKR